jgi:hypothetical protein
MHFSVKFNTAITARLTEHFTDHILLSDRILLNLDITPGVIGQPLTNNGLKNLDSTTEILRFKV